MAVVFDATILIDLFNPRLKGDCKAKLIPSTSGFPRRTPIGGGRDSRGIRAATGAFVEDSSGS